MFFNKIMGLHLYFKLLKYFYRKIELQGLL
jgi:hypothetical protein